MQLQHVRAGRELQDQLIQNLRLAHKESEPPEVKPLAQDHTASRLEPGGPDSQSQALFVSHWPFEVPFSSTVCQCACEQCGDRNTSRTSFGLVLFMNILN